MEGIAQYLSVNKCDPYDILRKQHYNGEFVRWDTVIRWICAEEYLKTGVLPCLYSKDVVLRHLEVHGNLDNFSPDLGEINFKRIIDFYIGCNSYKDTYPILLTANELLVDGTHRLGISAAFKFNFVDIAISNVGIDGEFVYFDYYKKRFTSKEILLMEKKYYQLMSNNKRY